MARKSILEGGASQSYEGCHGPKCGRPARQMVGLTQIDESGADVHLVPLCKECTTKATKNAATRGLPTPRATRLTKAVAEQYKEMETGKPTQINRRKPQGDWSSQQQIMRVHEARIHNLSPEHGEGMAPSALTGKDTPLARAYKDRHIANVNARRTPEQKAAILDEALKGLKHGRL